jgi:hypothetical protein
MSPGRRPPLFQLALSALDWSLIVTDGDGETDDCACSMAIRSKIASLK